MSGVERATEALEAIVRKYEGRIPRSTFEKRRLQVAREVANECLAAALNATAAKAGLAALDAPAGSEAKR